jgi:hypothetical protein
MMRAAPRRIWFTIAKNQDNHQLDHHRPSADDPLADDDHVPTDHPYAVSSEASGHLPGPTFSTGPHSYPADAKTTLVDGYTQLVTDRVRDGWSCHLITITFSRLPGPRGAIIGRMQDEVQRVYSAFVTRVHRKPKRASTDQLPVLIGAMDLPIYKKDRSSAPKVFCNGGLHFHGILMVPPSSRLKEPVVDHFAARVNLYVGQSVQRIDVRPVINGHRRVVDYVLKTVLRESLTYDEAVLVLPRARSEVTAPTPQTLPGSP